MTKKNKTKFKSPWQKITNYFQEVFAETKKISWPTREDTIRLTIIVISTSVVVSIVLSLLDYIFNLMLDLSL